MTVVEQIDALFFDSSVNLNNKSILEIGSRVVNYDLKKKLSERFTGFIFTGIDIIGGYGVDKVIDICNCEVEYEHYDAIFAITVFEHVTNWEKAFNNMKSMLKHNGQAFIIVPSVWPVHNFPVDCWRYSQAELEEIFSDFHIESMETMVQTPGKEECIFVRARKYSGEDLKLIMLKRAK